MTDITSTNLEAAFLDQQVAGALHGKVYAFTEISGKEGWQLGVAVANEQGFIPIVGKTFKDQGEAQRWAHGLNAHVGLSVDDASNIIISTMGGRRFERRSHQ